VVQKLLPLYHSFIFFKDVFRFFWGELFGVIKRDPWCGGGGGVGVATSV
jgi:hypothetical protein